jgi:hypothetical protein
MTRQIISIVGALLMLGAYFAFQRGWLARTHRSYHALNCVGASLLTYVAIADGQIGFIIVEGVWALLSVPGTIRPPRALAEPTA